MGFILTQRMGFGSGRRGNTDPSFASVTALLHMNGSDGSTTFTDVKGLTWTANGNAQIDTAQSKFGGASGLFDGTGDYVQATDAGQFDFGTGDFTIECWVRFNSTSGQQGILCSNVTTEWMFQKQSGGELSFGRNDVAWDVTASGSSLSANTWYHVAACRSGTTLRIFRDGTQVGSGTRSDNYSAGGSVNIGSDNVTAYFNGWIDDVRVTKGVARYTANFTAPTAAFPDS